MSIQSYRIKLTRICFRGKHGVSASERELFQDFYAEVEVLLPLAVLAQDDRYENVFDYDRIAKIVVEVGISQSCKLLETLVQQMLKRIFHETPALSARVLVEKSRPPTTPSVDTVSVELTATRE